MSAANFVIIFFLWCSYVDYNNIDETDDDEEP